MLSKGDSERQACLRDQRIKTRKTREDPYIPKVLAILKQQMKLLDIGCGTAHIIQKLAELTSSSGLVGLDVSPAMLRTARANTASLPVVGLVEGDGYGLPFPDCCFNIVVTRLANYSPQEAYRVLKEDGCFFEYGLGPEADREIKEFFPRRIEKENFFFPRNRRKWKQEVCESIIEAGSEVSSIEDYKEDEHCPSKEDLLDLLEMVPLVRDFDRTKDEKKINELVQKYGSSYGVKLTWHSYILTARKL